MKQQMYFQKKVLVIGLGVSGRSASYFLLKKGAHVWGIDKNYSNLENDQEILELKQMGLKASDETSAPAIENFDFVVISPGISPNHPIACQAKSSGKEVVGEIQLGCHGLENLVIGITGTNGKTTVTFLVAHILNRSGKKAHALGNVGVPFTKEVLSIDRNDTIVLELSSYQIDTLYEPTIQAGIILNITPDHLERYKTMETYAASKCSLEDCLIGNGILFIEEAAFKEFGYLLKKKPRVYGYGNQCDIYTDLEFVYVNGRQTFKLPLSLQGKKSHDLENLMGAFAICDHAGVKADDFLDAFQTFKKPPHRIEFVMEKEGIHYYDDSKGTNVDAVIRAIESLHRPIVLIAGGVDKGSAYTPWLKVFENKVKYICAIGQAAGKMKNQLSHQIPVEVCKDLKEAVDQARTCAIPGDIILLSPGCSSYDMFRDYAHRGEEFKKFVRAL